MVARTETIELFKEEDIKIARRARMAENKGLGGDADGNADSDDMIEKQH